jgi:predicted nucleic-acid-binding protein
MIALDTNILVRFLVRDDERQARLVYLRFKEAESKMERFFVPLLVVLETLWVLESAYDLARSEIVESFEALLQMPILLFESDAVVRNALKGGKKVAVDLSDLLIAHSSQAKGCDRVLTFDKKALRLPVFVLLK